MDDTLSNLSCGVNFRVSKLFSMAQQVGLALLHFLASHLAGQWTGHRCCVTESLLEPILVSVRTSFSILFLFLQDFFFLWCKLNFFSQQVAYISTRSPQDCAEADMLFIPPSIHLCQNSLREIGCFTFNDPERPGMLTVSQPIKFLKICEQTIFFLTEMKIHSSFTFRRFSFICFLCCFFLYFSTKLSSSLGWYKNDLKRSVAPVYTWS